MESRASMIIPALQTFPEQTLKQRITNGEMRHYTQEYPPMYVDCADERPLTQSHQLKRWEAPARHFGAATGVAAVYLAATIASNGHGRARNLINRYSNGLAGLAAEIATRANDKVGVAVHQHSADIIERNEDTIDFKLESPLGCAYMAKVGLVAASAGKVAVMEQTKRLIDGGNVEINNLSDVADGFLKLSQMLGGTEGHISREQLSKSVLNNRVHAPVAMVRGNHVSNQKATVVYDMESYTAKANGTDYFHSIQLPKVILSDIFNRLEVPESSLLEQASILTGAATQMALGVERTQVIPKGMTV